MTQSLYNVGGPRWPTWLLIVTGVLLLMLVSGCAKEPLVSDALHCSPEFEIAIDQLNSATLEAPDDVVLATDKVLSMHDRICKGGR